MRKIVFTARKVLSGVVRGSFEPVSDVQAKDNVVAIAF